MMNTVPEQSEVFVVVSGRDEAGATIFSVLVKRTYAIEPGLEAVRAERTVPFAQVDVYYDYGDAEWATVKHEADRAPYKRATDVVLIGKAYAPAGQPVTQLSAALEVDGYRRVIRVTGDRRCLFREQRAPVFTEPAAFTEMEIRYERAYGGKDTVSDPEVPFFYPRNPMGKGLAVKNSREIVEGLPVPNLEDPDDMLTPERVVLGTVNRWNQQPLPQGFGWYQKTWYPRCSFVGSVPGYVAPDEVMREELLGLVPQGQIALARQFKLPSFDVRFNNGASLGLARPYLHGGERVTLYNLTRDGQLAFSLPTETPRIMLDIGLGQNELSPVLHTVCIRPDEREVDLVWRGAHPYPGIDWLPEMPHMITEIA